MACFLRDNEDEILEENRYYWNITKLLQDMASSNTNLVGLNFKLHSTTWRNIFCLKDAEFVYIHIRSLWEDVPYLFELRAGIVGDDLKKIVAVKLCSLEKLITYSELGSILLSNKVVYLFIEVTRIDENLQKMNARK